MAKGKIGGFFVHLFILIVLFYSLIDIIFNFEAKMLIGEFILLLFFILIALIGIGMKLSSGSSKGLMFLYGLNLINFLFIFFVDKRLVAGTVILTIIAFVISLFGCKKCRQNDDFDSDIEEIEPVKSEVTTSFEPGKYVASKTGKKFHAPKCDWAKRIKKKSQVWFNDKDEAKKQKYKVCDCVK